MAEKTWSGTLYLYGTAERIEHAVILAQSPGQGKKQAMSDDDGDFLMKLEEAVEWNVTIMHQYCRPLQLQPFELTKDRKDQRIELHRISSTADKKAGTIFLYVCISALLLLTALYIILHLSVKSANGPLSPALFSRIDDTQDHLDSLAREEVNIRLAVNNALEEWQQKAIGEDQNPDSLILFLSDSLEELLAVGNYSQMQVIIDQMEKSESRHAATDSLKNALGNAMGLTDNPGLKRQLSALETELQSILKETKRLTREDKAILAGYHAHALVSIYKHEFPVANEQLQSLKQVVKSPPSHGFILWSHHPWQFLEILLWALAGVLAHKIIESGYYLRFNRFYREGINMHISHIAAIPFLVLVGMILLSLVSLQIDLPGSGNTATIDLSDHYILASLSFILAFRPWGMWQFIVSAGERVTGKDKRED